MYVILIVSFVFVFILCEIVYLTCFWRTVSWYENWPYGYAQHRNWFRSEKSQMKFVESLPKGKKIHVFVYRGLKYWEVDV